MQCDKGILEKNGNKTKHIGGGEAICKTMNEDKDFLRQDNNYRALKAFQKAECIYDVTYYFAHTYLKAGDRTIDQMVQAARSGKQNLAEGNIDGVTSREMEIKLTNVNRTSLHELLLDYEDYLRVRGLENGPSMTPDACRHAPSASDTSTRPSIAKRSRNARPKPLPTLPSPSSTSAMCSSEGSSSVRSASLRRRAASRRRCTVPARIGNARMGWIGIMGISPLIS